MFSQKVTITVTITMVFLLLAAIPVAGAAPTPGTSEAARQPTTTVSGVVRLDGAPLAGVEVWIGEFGTSTPMISHYTCTDDAGAFSFDAVATDTDLVAAVGIEVNLAEPCSNPLFVDSPSTRGAVPLVTQYWDHQNATLPGYFQIASGSGPATLNFDLIRWPLGGDAGLRILLTRSIQFFHRGNSALARRMVERFDRRVMHLEARGTLSASEAATLLSYSDHLANVVYAIRP